MTRLTRVRRITFRGEVAVFVTWPWEKPHVALVISDGTYLSVMNASSMPIRGELRLVAGVAERSRTG
jgi:hypothetical protein